MTINKDNFREILCLIQDELTELNLDMPDWIYTDFIFYIYGNIEESSEDEVLFKVYDKVVTKLEREQKINNILDGK
jgi:hypothetical protein